MRLTKSESRNKVEANASRGRTICRHLMETTTTTTTNMSKNLNGDNFAPFSRRTKNSSASKERAIEKVRQDNSSTSTSISSRATRSLDKNNIKSEDIEEKNKYKDFKFFEARKSENDIEIKLDNEDENGSLKSVALSTTSSLLSQLLNSSCLSQLIEIDLSSKNSNSSISGSLNSAALNYDDDDDDDDVSCCDGLTTNEDLDEANYDQVDFIGYDDKRKLRENGKVNDSILTQTDSHSEPSSCRPNLKLDGRDLRVSKQVSATNRLPLIRRQNDLRRRPIILSDNQDLFSTKENSIEHLKSKTLTNGSYKSKQVKVSVSSKSISHIQNSSLVASSSFSCNLQNENENRNRNRNENNKIKTILNEDDSNINKNSSLNESDSLNWPRNVLINNPILMSLLNSSSYQKLPSFSETFNEENKEKKKKNNNKPYQEDIQLIRSNATESMKKVVEEIPKSSWSQLEKLRREMKNLTCYNNGSNSNISNNNIKSGSVDSRCYSNSTTTTTTNNNNNNNCYAKKSSEQFGSITQFDSFLETNKLQQQQENLKLELKLGVRNNNQSRQTNSSSLSSISNSNDAISSGIGSNNQRSISSSSEQNKNIEEDNKKQQIEQQQQQQQQQHSQSNSISIESDFLSSPNSTVDSTAGSSSPPSSTNLRVTQTDQSSSSEDRRSPFHQSTKRGTPRMGLARSTLSSHRSSKSSISESQTKMISGNQKQQQNHQQQQQHMRHDFLELDQFDDCDETNHFRRLAWLLAENVKLKGETNNKLTTSDQTMNVWPIETKITNENLKESDIQFNLDPREAQISRRNYQYKDEDRDEQSSVFEARAKLARVVSSESVNQSATPTRMFYGRVRDSIDLLHQVEPIYDVPSSALGDLHRLVSLTPDQKYPSPSGKFALGGESHFIASSLSNRNNGNETSKCFLYQQFEPKIELSTRKTCNRLLNVGENLKRRRRRRRSKNSSRFLVRGLAEAQAREIGRDHRVRYDHHKRIIEDNQSVSSYSRIAFDGSEMSEIFHSDQEVRGNKHRKRGEERRSRRRRTSKTKNSTNRHKLSEQLTRRRRKRREKRLKGRYLGHQDSSTTSCCSLCCSQQDTGECSTCCDTISSQLVSVSSQSVTGTTTTTTTTGCSVACRACRARQLSRRVVQQSDGSSMVTILDDLWSSSSPGSLTQEYLRRHRRSRRRNRSRRIRNGQRTSRRINNLEQKHSQSKTMTGTEDLRKDSEILVGRSHVGRGSLRLIKKLVEPERQVSEEKKRVNNKGELLSKKRMTIGHANVSEEKQKPTGDKRFSLREERETPVETNGQNLNPTQEATTATGEPIGGEWERSGRVIAKKIEGQQRGERSRRIGIEYQKQARSRRVLAASSSICTSISRLERRRRRRRRERERRIQQRLDFERRQDQRSSKYHDRSRNVRRRIRRLIMKHKATSSNISRDSSGYSRLLLLRLLYRRQQEQELERREFRRRLKLEGGPKLGRLKLTSSLLFSSRSSSSANLASSSFMKKAKYFDRNLVNNNNNNTKVKSRGKNNIGSKPSGCLWFRSLKRRARLIENSSISSSEIMKIKANLKQQQQHENQGARMNMTKLARPSKLSQFLSMQRYYQNKQVKLGSSKRDWLNGGRRLAVNEMGQSNGRQQLIQLQYKSLNGKDIGESLLENQNMSPFLVKTFPSNSIKASAKSSKNQVKFQRTIANSQGAEFRDEIMRRRIRLNGDDDDDDDQVDDFDDDGYNEGEERPNLFKWQLASRCQCEHCLLVQNLIRMDLERKLLRMRQRNPLARHHNHQQSEPF